MTVQRATAQNTIGIPTIINYPKQLYNAGSQNWNIAQGPEGIVYFANNQGLLSFDGTFWRRYPLPNKTIVRSVSIGKEGRIYVGGQSEFGFFAPGKRGDLVYTSLMPLLKDSARDFTDVWNICLYQDHIFFRAYRKIFEYDGKAIRVHEGVQWNFLGATVNSLLAFENNKGLVRFNNGQWIPAVCNTTLSPGINIKASIAIGKDSTLIATLTHGLFLLQKDSIVPFLSPDLAFIAQQNIYGLSLIAPDRIAVVTNLSGCLIINSKGQLIQRISKKEGLQNNNILSLLLDQNRNLWLGLDNGIDLVLYNNAIKNIFPEPEDKNAGYSSRLFQNRLYLGLASGAYQVALDSVTDLSDTRGSFSLVAGSKGQVWNFSEVNGQLLMGHNEGAFRIEESGQKAIPIDTKTGFWDFQSLTSGNSNISMLAGTYNGINFYNYENGVFTNPKIHAHFESARFVVRMKDDIWIAHPFKGLYKVSFDASGKPVVDIYKDRQHILSANHNKLFKVENRMVLTTDNGIFEYREDKSDFLPSIRYKMLFDGTPVSYLREDPYHNIWFSRGRKIGVLDRSSGKEELVFIPELNNRIQADGFENITIIDSSNVLIAGENGFFHLNYAQYKKNRYALKVLIRNVRFITQKDSLLYGGYQPTRTDPCRFLFFQRPSF
jgi:hypothetical protein